MKKKAITTQTKATKVETLLTKLRTHLYLLKRKQNDLTVWIGNQKNESGLNKVSVHNLTQSPLFLPDFLMHYDANEVYWLR